MKAKGVDFGRAAIALALLSALVIGVPLLLVTVVGNPLPSEFPSLSEIQILLTQNGQGFTDFLMSALAVLVWVTWFQLIIALAVEIFATTRQIETPRLRLVPGMEGFASRLIAAITLVTVLAAGPLVAPAVGALSFGDATSVVTQPEPAVDVRSFLSSSVATSISKAQLGDAAILGRETSPANEASYMLVRDHTELWDLADAAYGDGVSWKRIARANAGSFDANGVPITADTEVVAPGTEIILPGPIEGAEAGRFGSLTHRRYREVGPVVVLADSDLNRVDSGDSMWTMAESHVAGQLGRTGTEAEVASYWVDLVAANQDVSSGDVDMIHPGEMLAMPESPSNHMQQLIGTVLDPAREPSTQLNGSDYVVTHGPIDSRSSPLISNSDPADPQTHYAVEKSDSPSAAPVSEPDPVAPSIVGADTSTNNGAPAPAVGLVALGAAMLSSGVASAIRRRRDVQRRTRPPGTMAPAPSSEAAAFEAAILHSSHSSNKARRVWGGAPCLHQPLEPCGQLAPSRSTQLRRVSL